MSNFIDRKELLKAMDTWDKFGYTHTGAFIRNPHTEDYVPYVHYEDMVKCVSNMPTADVRENVKGEWVEEPFMYDVDSKGRPMMSISIYCSACKEEVDEKTNFCPHCGAEMRSSQPSYHGTEIDGMFIDVSGDGTVIEQI